MALSATLLANTNNNTSGASITTAATITAAVGTMVVVMGYADNGGAAGIGSITNITDSVGNTYDTRLLDTYTLGVTGDGVSLIVATLFVTTALSGATISLNVSPNTADKGVMAFNVVGGTNEYPSFGSMATTAKGAATAATAVTINGMTVGSIGFGIVAVENLSIGTGDSDTLDGSWSAQTTADGALHYLAVQSKVLTGGPSNQSFTGFTGFGSARDYVSTMLYVKLESSGALGAASASGEVSGLAAGDYLSTAAASGSGVVTGAAAGDHLSTASATGAGTVTGASEAHASTTGAASGASPVSGLTDAVEETVPVIPPVSESTAGVLYWQGFPGPAGYFDAPTFGQFPIDVGVNVLNLRDSRGYAYLLRATVPDDSDLMVEAYETFYPAASLGRSTTPEDIPANTYVPGALLGSTINYGIKLFNGIEPSANSSGGAGSIVLIDPSGVLDYIIDMPWDGAQLDILQGPPRAKFNTFSIVGKLTTAGILYDPRRKEVRLRDQADRLTKAGLHDQQFGGTGGADGTPELEGVYKPYGVGPNFNVSPILIDPPRQIRQLSCSAIQAVDAVRDGGAVITATGVNYANYAALAAAADISAIPGGQFSTCLAEGLIALGSIPVLGLTVDFRGDATVINGTGYVDTIGTIVRRIATGRGDIKFTDSDLDFSTLNSLTQIQTGVCGWWWEAGSTQVTKAEALTMIMDSRLGWWAVRLNGLLAFGVIDEPEQSPAMVINYPEDFAGEPQQLDTYQVPRKSTYVGYKKNNTIQDASQLAGISVDAGDALIYGQPTYYAHSDSVNPVWLWPTAQVVKIDGGFDDLAPALVEAARQQTVMGQRRERWTIPVPCSAFADVLGKIIQVNNYPRYGWGTSRKFICVGVSFASGIAVTLDLWG